MNIPKPEFPRPDFERKNWMNLNGEWFFRLFKEGCEEQERVFSASERNYSDKIIVPFSWTSPLSGIEQDKTGVGWYMRSAVFDSYERVIICFGAVDYIADVYINGIHVGHHKGGYTQFEFDITDLWRTGENIIEVRAEDYRKNSQTRGKQSYGEIQGIWQTVWLESRPASYISNMHFTTKCSGDVIINADVVMAKPGRVSITAAFDDKSHKLDKELAAGENRICFPIKISDPKLWSPDTPYLYHGSISLEADSSKDTVYTYFGLREIGAKSYGIRSYKWITLNGKPVYLNGTLDQAFNPKGYFTYPSDNDMRDEAWRLKRLGLNMVRIHIKPEEPRKLYWMDKLGILVMVDMPCFFGSPDEEARLSYEAEWPEIIMRDINHPSIFSWVMFNETWGLFTKEGDKNIYTQETRAWVREIYKQAKKMDPGRLIEDNSPCNRDHVESDINSWHFYINGYEQVRNHIREVADNTFSGSGHNYAEGCFQGNAPLLNSECGMVWGVEGSAGDSDLAWQYHYMLNEFRLNEKVCGFIFTEFHDVVNEFNGYYRIDNNDKDFGYQDFCRGMSLKDLHSDDFVAIDAPPCRTVNACETVTIPLVLSSFSNKNHGKPLSIYWELWHDSLEGRICDMSDEIKFSINDYGTQALGLIEAVMPNDNAVAVLSIYLKDQEDNIISRNFTTFDVRQQSVPNIIAIPVSDCEHEGFSPVWKAQGGQKVCFGGSGSASYNVCLKDLELQSICSMTLYFEAGAKRVLTKDTIEEKDETESMAFMFGKLVDRGRFKNSYYMTDNDKISSCVEVYINDIYIETIHLENDPADARGVLSWHYQQSDKRLDEAGSYGELKKVHIPSRLIPQIVEEKQMNITLKVIGNGGLALYGRNSGRYPVDMLIRYK